MLKTFFASSWAFTVIGKLALLQKEENRRESLQKCSLGSTENIFNSTAMSTLAFASSAHCSFHFEFKKNMHATFLGFFFRSKWTKVYGTPLKSMVPLLYVSRLSRTAERNCECQCGPCLRVSTFWESAALIYTVANHQHKKETCASDVYSSLMIS